MAEPNLPKTDVSAPKAQLPETVPEELLEKLHEANQRFSSARHHREEAIDSASPETFERDKAAQEIRDAEANVEKVTDEIDRDLHPLP
jgi:chromosome segregation ATPase